jgi:hypothetical protein
VRRRHAEGDGRRLDLLLGADETLGHGLLGDEKCTSDLIRAQTAERAQRQRDLGVELEGRVAAIEVTEEADQARDDAAPLVAEDLLEDR